MDNCKVIIDKDEYTILILEDKQVEKNVTLRLKGGEGSGNFGHGGRPGEVGGSAALNGKGVRADNRYDPYKQPEKLENPPTGLSTIVDWSHPNRVHDSLIADQGNGFQIALVKDGKVVSSGGVRKHKDYWVASGVSTVESERHKGYATEMYRDILHYIHPDRLHPETGMIAPYAQRIHDSLAKMSDIDQNENGIKLISLHRETKELTLRLKEDK